MNEQQDLYDVVELLLTCKDQGLAFVEDTVSSIDDREEIIMALRRFVYQSLQMPYDDVMSYVDEELFETYTDLAFYLEPGTYSPASEERH